MKGVIRSRGTCPKCQGPFVDVSKKISMFRHLGFICPACKIIPVRFYIDLYHQGQRIRIFSDKQGQPLDTYQRAVNFLYYINYEIKNHNFDPSRYIKTELEKFWVSKFLDQFLEYKLKYIAPSYARHYTRIVNIAKDYFNTKDVRELKKIDLINYKEHLENKYDISSKSVKNILDLFKTFLRYCKNDLEIIDNVPAFPRVKVAKHNFKWLAQEDQTTLFKNISDKDKPIIAFLMLHGCRPSEARALKCKDIDLKTQTIKISASFSGNVYREKKEGKSSKSITIPIHPEMYEYISERIRNNLPESFIFINPRTGKYYSPSALDRVWFSARQKTGITENLRLYDATRHSFASQLVNSGTSLFKASRLLGHSSIKMTEKYAYQHIENLRTDIKKLSLNKLSAVTKLSPEAIQAKK